MRFIVIGARVLSWPLTGLITDGPLAALAAAAGVIGLSMWSGLFGIRSERTAARWLGLGLVWTALLLTFLSPSLATVVPGLPNDHYHAFADPMVFTLVGIGAVAVWRGRAAALPGGSPDRTIRRGFVVVAVAGVLAWNLPQQPPAVNPDGGFPAAAEAADRIIAATDTDAFTLRSLPDFKSTEAYGYPLIRAGAVVRVDAGTGTIDATADSLVIICDSLFVGTIGAPCGGEAETRVAPPSRFGEPLLRFEAAPGRFISVYGPSL